MSTVTNVTAEQQVIGHLVWQWTVLLRQLHDFLHKHGEEHDLKVQRKVTWLSGMHAEINIYVCRQLF